jgi:hypothetical protein
VPLYKILGSLLTIVFDSRSSKKKKKSRSESNDEEGGDAEGDDDDEDNIGRKGRKFVGRQSAISKAIIESDDDEE